MPSFAYTSPTFPGVNAGACRVPQHCALRKSLFFVIAGKFVVGGGTGVTGFVWSGKQLPQMIMVMMR